MIQAQAPAARVYGMISYQIRGSDKVNYQIKGLGLGSISRVDLQIDRIRIYGKFPDKYR